MKEPLKPRDKIVQKMTREGAIEINETKSEAKRISNRIRDADFQTTPEQPPQEAEPISAASVSSTPTAYTAPSKQNTGTAERVFERLDAGHTRSASKKAVQKAQKQATAKTKSSRLQFTEEERSIPELKQYIAKSEKAADRLDAAKAAIPKEKKLVRERVFDEAAGKGKTRLHFEEREKPPNFKGTSSPLSRPVQEAGVFVHNKVHSVEKDNSGVEGAHKAEEAAERGLRYGKRRVQDHRRSQKLKPYRASAKAEKAAYKANVEYQYQKVLHENPQLKSNPVSRFWQKQQIKKQYAKTAKAGGTATAKAATENARKAAKKTAEKTEKTVSFVARHPAGVAIAVGGLLLTILLFTGLSSCSSLFSGVLNGIISTKEITLRQAMPTSISKAVPQSRSTASFAAGSAAENPTRTASFTLHRTFRQTTYRSLTGLIPPCRCSVITAQPAIP